MYIRVFLIYMLAGLISACATVPPQPVTPQNVRLNWVGTYKVLGSQRSDYSSITGKISRAIGWQLEQRTTDIVASVGTRFGINYTFEGTDSNVLVPHRVIIRYPEGGLTNPVTNRTAMSFTREKTCHIGVPSLAGQAFSEPWELVPGIWVVEIWLDNKLIASQPFTVSISKSN